MPNYSKLHDLISHRVTIEYDTGARVTGYLSSCQPASGPVEFVVLSEAKLIDSRGRLPATTLARAVMWAGVVPQHRQRARDPPQHAGQADPQPALRRPGQQQDDPGQREGGRAVAVQGDVAREADVIRIDETRVEMRHPLLRSTIYHAATAPERCSRSSTRGHEAQMAGPGGRCASCVRQACAISSSPHDAGTAL